MLTITASARNRSVTRLGDVRGARGTFWGVGHPLVDLPIACALVVRARSTIQRRSTTGAPRPVPSGFCRPLTATTDQPERDTPVANIKSQLKRIKTNRVATERNKAVKSELKTWIRKFREAVDSGDARRRQGCPRGRLDQARQGREQGRHPREPGRQQEVGDGQEGRRALTRAPSPARAGHLTVTGLRRPLPSGAGRAVPALQRPCGVPRATSSKRARSEAGALAPHRVGVDPHDPVDPDLARPALPVPAAPADVDPGRPSPRLLGGVAVVVLARQHAARAATSPSRPTTSTGRSLPRRVVLLVRHPRPDDLARVGPAVRAGAYASAGTPGSRPGRHGARARAGRVGA